MDYLSEKHRAFMERNKYRKNIGKCVICRGPSEWNEEKGRYERFCSDACKKKYVDIRNKRMLDKYGTTNLAADMDFQKNKLLANRSIALTYEFADGSKYIVLSKVEYDILSELEKMGFTGDDIEAPASFVIEYNLDGKKLHHIPDIYIKSLNLIISAKDGLDNPNTHPSFQKDRKKNIVIFKSILDNYKYNYIQVEGAESKVTSEVINVAKKIISKNQRFVIPPRIDFVMYQEMEQEYTSGLINKVHHAIIELSEGFYKCTYFSSDIASGNVIVPLEEDGINYFTSFPIDDLLDRNSQLYIVNLSKYNISASAILESSSSNLLTLARCINMPMTDELTIDMIMDYITENCLVTEFEDFLDSMHTVEEVIENEHITGNRQEPNDAIQARKY